MVRIERRTIITKKPEPVDQPYSLVDLVVNGQPVQGRPYEFDSEPANANTVRNANGDPIRPTRCVTSCPECGAGLEVPLPVDREHPYKINCAELGGCVLHPAPVQAPVPVPVTDPFRCPFDDEGMSELDMKLVDALSIPALDTRTTVADRLRETLP